MHSAVFVCLALLGAASAYQPAPLRASASVSSSACRHGAPQCLGGLSPTQAASLAVAAAGAGDAVAAEPLQQQQRSAAWPKIAAQATLPVLAALALTLGGDVRSASAENELEALAYSKSTSELVNPQCFAKSCKGQMEACANDGDCMKGLACTAKCMGDAQCTVGCFARYNDANLEKVLQCTIEDAGCIAIATQAPGADTLAEAPLPPKALVKATPASMSGKWYKVLGFNPNYDCFECQRNSFATTTASNVASVDGDRANARAVEASTTINGGTAAVQVEYAMPRTRIGMPPETFHSTLNEKLEFDAPNSRRTAHTEGRMFGLTFWENWYVIGQNQPREPEFRMVYYTGKTLQNRYEGAFVYARKPELPQAAMPAIYKLAREANLDPTHACCIDNSCFAQPVDAGVAQPPPFTPVAEAGVVSLNGDLPAAQSTTTYAGATTTSGDGPLGALTRPLRNTVRDLTELFEDPKPYGDDLFGRQRLMTEVREYDPNGYPTAGLGVR